jgi:hypothetical protein
LVELEQDVWGQGRVVEKPGDGGPAFVVKGCFAVSVAAGVKPVNGDANCPHAPLRAWVVGPQKEAQVAVRFGGNHPPPKCLRILAIHIDSGDVVIELGAVLKLELPLEIDLDQGSAVGFLGLEKLVPAVPAGALAIVKLIEGVSQNLGSAHTLRIERLDRGGYGYEFGVLGGMGLSGVGHRKVLIWRNYASGPSR